jgi:carboxylesterase type B
VTADTTVTTAGGTVRGARRGDWSQFLGIPFALAPRFPPTELGALDRRPRCHEPRTGGATAASVQASAATAAAAATFQCPSGDLAARYSGDSMLGLLAAALPYAILAVPGAA